MKIFFAYSSRGDVGYRDTCIQIGLVLGRFGKIFSERSGDVETAAIGDKDRHSEIFSGQIGLLRKSDILVAEVSEPSLGVGYEIAEALHYEKRVLCLFQSDGSRTVSSMLAGNKDIALRQYESMMDVERIVKNFL